jgi:hypothetical protein
MNKRQLISAWLALAMVALTPLHAVAGEEGWVLLGTRDVNLTADRDIIHVGADSGAFNRIRLDVKGNGLFVFDLNVVYSSGGHDNIPLQFQIPENGSTRAIDLRGGNRNIRHVEMIYRRPANGQGRTTVELWGHRSE